MAWAAGVIHVQAAIHHFDRSRIEAVLFVLLATAQFVWGAAVYSSPTPWLMWLGALGSVAVIAAWTVSRTAGLPFGPQPWNPEAVGLIDALATADEAALALLAGVRTLPSHLCPRRLITGAATGLALVLILLSSLTLAGGAPHTH